MRSRRCRELPEEHLLFWMELISEQVPGARHITRTNIQTRVRVSYQKGLPAGRQRWTAGPYSWAEVCASTVLWLQQRPPHTHTPSNTGVCDSLVCVFSRTHLRCRASGLHCMVEHLQNTSAGPGFWLHLRLCWSMLPGNKNKNLSRGQKPKKSTKKNKQLAVNFTANHTERQELHSSIKSLFTY